MLKKEQILSNKSSARGYQDQLDQYKDLADRDL